MRKGRERGRKGEEMVGWDEDVVGSLGMINGDDGDEFGIT